MSGEKDLEQLKKEAAAKAKEAALAKKKRMEAGETSKPAEAPSKEEAKPEPVVDAPKQEAPAEQTPAETPEVPVAASGDDDDLAKKKAAAVAKAKAAAAAKRKAMELAAGGASVEETPAAETTTEASNADDDLAKKKAAAVAKAKAAAAAKAKAAAGGSTGDDEKAKAIAAAKAKAAAAAAAKAKAGGAAKADAEPAEPAKPSVNQPYLDKYVKVIKEHLGEEVLEDFYINKLSKDVPTLVATGDSYYKIAEFLKFNEQLGFDYLSELHGSDFESHMEVYAHFYSYKNRQSVALKVKIDRNKPEIESLQPLWNGANWPECEAFDLLGINFKGHPNLHRIMLGEEWIGHPLRKDYEPYDVEV